MDTNDRSFFRKIYVLIYDMDMVLRFYDQNKLKVYI